MQNFREYLSGITLFVGVMLWGGSIWLGSSFSDQQVVYAQTLSSEMAIQLQEAHQSNVIYLGEKHDSPEHHQQQLKIITQLARQSPRKLAIALEMFQRPFQSSLNRYLAGELSESELQTQTEFASRWGYDWEFYAPVLRLAQQAQIPVIALNTPSEVTQQVAQSGLASLSESDQRDIPPLADIELGPGDYVAELKAVYQEHSNNSRGSSLNLDNFVAAQILWDETMAEAIADYWEAHPQTLIVALVGQAHVQNDYGIPRRVARRLAQQKFRQTQILLHEAI